MRKLIAPVSALAIILMAGTAFAQQPPVPDGCKRITAPKPADDKAFDIVQFRRPAVGEKVRVGSIVTIELSGAPGLNFSDAHRGADRKVIAIDECKSLVGVESTLYWVLVSKIEDGHEIIEVPVPKTVAKLKAESCSVAAGRQCFEVEVTDHSKVDPMKKGRKI